MRSGTGAGPRRVHSLPLQRGGWPAPVVNRTRARRARQNVEEDLATTRTYPRLLTLGAIFVFVAAACSSGGATTAPGSSTGGGGASTAPGSSTGAGSSGGTGAAGFNPDPALVAAAKAEGALNTIALPRDWCNYGESI